MSAELNRVVFGATLPTPVQFEMVRTEVEYLVKDENDLSEAKEKAFVYFDSIAKEYGKEGSTFIKKT